MITVHYLVQITPNALLGHSCDKIDRSMMIKLDFLRPTVRFGSVQQNGCPPIFCKIWRLCSGWLDKVDVKKFNVTVCCRLTIPVASSTALRPPFYQTVRWRWIVQSPVRCGTLFLPQMKKNTLSEEPKDLSEDFRL